MRQGGHPLLVMWGRVSISLRAGATPASPVLAWGGVGGLQCAETGPVGLPLTILRVKSQMGEGIMMTRVYKSRERCVFRSKQSARAQMLEKGPFLLPWGLAQKAQHSEALGQLQEGTEVLEASARPLGEEESLSLLVPEQIGAVPGYS